MAATRLGLLPSTVTVTRSLRGTFLTVTDSIKRPTIPSRISVSVGSCCCSPPSSHFFKENDFLAPLIRGLKSGSFIRFSSRATLAIISLEVRIPSCVDIKLREPPVASYMSSKPIICCPSASIIKVAVDWYFLGRDIATKAAIIVTTNATPKIAQRRWRTRFTYFVISNSF